MPFSKVLILLYLSQIAGLGDLLCLSYILLTNQKEDDTEIHKYGSNFCL